MERVPANALTIEFVSGWASDMPEYCQDYILGHRKVLEDFGILNVTTNNDQWARRSDVFVICALDKSDKTIVGGVRVEIMTNQYNLPFVKAVEKIDSKIFEVVDQDSPHLIGEVCGLWNSKRVFGRGVSVVLSRLAVAVSLGLNVERLYCLVAQYTLDIATSLGFVVESRLGKDGFFSYPNDRFHACVLRIADVEYLPLASAEERMLIQRIRSGAVSRNSEIYNSRNLVVDYGGVEMLKLKDR
jgi:hypothetical protein